MAPVPTLDSITSVHELTEDEEDVHGTSTRPSLAVPQSGLPLPHRRRLIRPQREPGCTEVTREGPFPQSPPWGLLLLQLQDPLSLLLPSGLLQTPVQGRGQGLDAGDLGSPPGSA